MKDLYGRVVFAEDGGFSFLPADTQTANTQELPSWGYFNQHSQNEMQGVDSQLVQVVKAAAAICAQEFGVHDGLRTLAEQQKLIASGASRTMKSKHLKGRAVDLVPLVNGKWRWEWEPIYIIVDAVRTAAQAEKLTLVWGGAWHTTLTDRSEPPEDLLNEYGALRRSQGRKPFFDGAHFELPD